MAATALYINGVFEETLAEIMEAQDKLPDHTFYLQPYKGTKITLLERSPPTPDNPITLYVSLTDSLHSVSYRAQIVGWNDKRELSVSAKATLNEAIRQFQPKEKEVFDKAGTNTPCVNLIHIVNLEKLVPAHPIANFIKVRDGMPLQLRSRSGGWSYVFEKTQNRDSMQLPRLEDVVKSFESNIQKSEKDTSVARKMRLAIASKLPQLQQVTTYVYRRNADVVVEVRERAKGVCERCNSKAPFNRFKDGKPYLEVHHIQTLADGGKDTIENAIALCPNCHRELHFGIAGLTKDE